MYLFILAYLILLLSFFSYSERFNAPSSEKISTNEIDGSIQGSNIRDGSIQGTDIDKDTIDGSNIKPDSIPLNKLNINATEVPWSKIKVTGTEVPWSNIKVNDAQIPWAKLTNVPTNLGGTSGGTTVTYTNSILKVANTDVTNLNLGLAGTLTCASLNIGSDRRIKQNIQPLPLVSLDILRKLKPVRYQLKADSDKSDKKEVCGFIAQDIQETLPSAVRIQTRFISNICDEATVDQDILTFATFFTADLEKGALSKIKVKDEETEDEFTILEVLDEHRIRIDKAFHDKVKVFVIGEEVSDFMTIDSHQIFTIATAALQELDQKVQQLEKLDQKVQRLEELDAKVQQLDTKSKRLDELNAKVQRLEELTTKVQRLEKLNAKVQRLEEENKALLQRVLSYTRSEIL